MIRRSCTFYNFFVYRHNLLKIDSTQVTKTSTSKTTMVSMRSTLNHIICFDTNHFFSIILRKSRNTNLNKFWYVTVPFTFCIEWSDMWGVLVELSGKTEIYAILTLWRMLADTSELTVFSFFGFIIKQLFNWL